MVMSEFNTSLNAEGLWLSIVPTTFLSATLVPLQQKDHQFVVGTNGPFAIWFRYFLECWMQCRLCPDHSIAESINNSCATLCETSHNESAIFRSRAYLGYPCYRDDCCSL